MEDNVIRDEQARHVGDEAQSVFNDMSDRINQTMENFGDIADDIEEYSGEIKALLEDLRILQSSLELQNREKLEPLVDQLEGLSKELENAVWTMDCVKEVLPEDIDIAQILRQPVDSPD